MGTTNMSLTVLPYDLDNSLLGRVPSTDIHCNAAGSIKTCCCLYAFQSHLRQPTYDYKKIRAPLKAPRPLPFRRPRLLGSESTSEGFGGSDYIRSVYYVVHDAEVIKNHENAAQGGDGTAHGLQKAVSVRLGHF